MLVTTYKKSDLKEFGPFYYAENRANVKLEKDDNLMLFKGYLYPDLKEKIEDLFSFLETKGVNEGVKSFKGRYCGCFINKKDNCAIIFNDQLGLNDIFYYYDNDHFIAGDRFTDFFSIRKFNKDDLDVVAMAEFLLYEYPFCDRTFLKDVKLLPVATIKMFDIGASKSRMIRYWQYIFNTDENFDRERAFEKVDLLLRKSINRIKALNPDKKFSIGLSGGYDSRLTAKYAVDAGIDIRAFVYNHDSSDAWYISQKLAKKIGTPLKRLDIKNDFMSLKDMHINYDPMHSLRYASYCTVMNELPEADALLTGYLGGTVFGSGIREYDFNPDMSIVEKNNKRALTYQGKPFISEKVLQEIMDDFRRFEALDSEDWKIGEIFYIENRQLRFTKSSPNFNFYGRYEQYYSIFTDIDLVEFLLTFPAEELMNNRFYHDFHKRYLPVIAKIRNERQAYTIYDGPLIKKLKSKALNFKIKLLKDFGIRLPIYRTINFLGHFNWQKLFEHSNFDQDFIDIEVQGIDAKKIKTLSDMTLSVKFHYLTLQNFMTRFIDKS